MLLIVVVLTGRWIVLALRDRVARRELAVRLSEAGAQVLEADSSLHAVADLSDWILSDRVDGRPDVVVTDADMPWSGGLSLVSELRALGWLTPAVFLVRRDDVDLRAHALSLAPSLTLAVDTPAAVVSEAVWKICAHLAAPNVPIGTPARPRPRPQ